MSHLAILPVILPLLTGIVLLLLRPVHAVLRRRASLLSAVAQLVVATVLLQAVGGGEILVYPLGNWAPPYGIVLVADRLAAWMVLITALVALFALLHASLGTDRAGRHFHVLFQLQLFGLNGAFLTGDLFNLFVFFEVLLLASYGLLLHGGGRLRTGAGLHFVVINLAGSTLFLFAVGTLYGVLGTLNMADLAQRIAAVAPEQLGLVQAAGLLLLGVFALKAALVPLHVWLPSAYAETSASVAALFTIMTKVGAYAILRLDALVFGSGPAAGLIGAWVLPLALATLLVGMLGLMACRGLRRQVAYGGVASAGSLLVAFGIGNGSGIAAGLFYLPHTTFAGAAFFLLADSIAKRRGEAADRIEPGVVLPDRALLGVLYFVVVMLVVGLPPSGGFIAKFLTLHAAVGHPALAWILLVVLGGGVLGVIALARSGSVLFYRSLPAVDAPGAARSGATRELLPMGGLLLLCLGIILWAGPLHEFASATADQLLHSGDYVRAVLGSGAGGSP